MINIGLKEELGITQFNHVSMVVKDLDQVLPILLIHGWKLTHRFTHKEAGRSLMSLDHPDYATKLEVMAPVGDDSYLWKFLATQGNGSQHHITFYVMDLAKARKVLESRGFELHRDRPHEILIHPKRGGGTMVQFFQTPHKSVDDALESKTETSTAQSQTTRRIRNLGDSGVWSVEKGRIKLVVNTGVKNKLSSRPDLFITTPIDSPSLFIVRSSSQKMEIVVGYAREGKSLFSEEREWVWQHCYSFC